MKSIMLLISLLLPAKVFAQTTDSLIVLGKKFTLQSEVLGQSREYWVYLPPSYHSSESKSHHYPVVYLLDGDTYFIPSAGILDDLSQCHITPEMIVVAILHNDRTHDLWPYQNDTDRFGRKNPVFKNSGHTDDFLRFVKNELFVKIEQTYRTLPYRIFVGHSSGGLTVLYTLLNHAGMFNAYVAVDPGAVTNNERVMYDFLPYLKANDLSLRKLFLSLSNNDSQDDPYWADVFKPTKTLISYFEKDNHSKIQWQYKYYPRDNHITVYTISFYDALRFIFESYSINFVKDRLRPDVINTKFQKMSSETGVTFTPPEDLINYFGTQAQSIYPTIPKGLDAAIRFFEINLDNYPESIPSLLNLGDAWLKKGDAAKAKSYYEKVLVIDTANESAKKKIGEMEVR